MQKLLTLFAFIMLASNISVNAMQRTRDLAKHDLKESAVFYDQLQQRVFIQSKLARLGSISGLNALYHTRSNALKTKRAQAVNNKSDDQQSPKATSKEHSKEDLVTIQQNLPEALSTYVASFYTTPAIQLIKQNMHALIPLVLEPRANKNLLLELKTIQITLKNKAESNEFKNYVNALKETAERQGKTFHPVIIGTAGFFSTNGTNNFNEYVAFTTNLTDLDQCFFRTFNTPLNPFTNEHYAAVLFSDGSIKWIVSTSNQAILENNLLVEQIDLAVELFNKAEPIEYSGFDPRESYSFYKPVVLNEEQQEVYNILEPAIRKKIMLNYPHMKLNKKEAQEYKKEQAREGLKKSAKSYGKALVPCCIIGITTAAPLYLWQKYLNKNLKNYPIGKACLSLGIAQGLIGYAREATNRKNKHSILLSLVSAASIGAWVYWVTGLK